LTYARVSTTISSAMKNIVLTGFMGTGKTAVGKELARLLDIRLIDLDSEIEKAEHQAIRRKKVQGNRN
jgi:shikimate kinase